MFSGFYGFITKESKGGALIIFNQLDKRMKVYFYKTPNMWFYKYGIFRFYELLVRTDENMAVLLID